MSTIIIFLDNKNKFHKIFINYTYGNTNIYGDEHYIYI